MVTRLLLIDGLICSVVILPFCAVVMRYLDVVVILQLHSGDQTCTVLEKAAD